jgi:histidinol dehydrogenase
MNINDIKITKWTSEKRPALINRFVKRPLFEQKVGSSVKSILDDIRSNGDSAVQKYTRKFDSSPLKSNQWAVTKQELLKARESIIQESEFVDAVREVHSRVIRFSKQEKMENWTMSSPKGGFLGAQFTPLRRVGVYIPGGTAPLISTVLMTIPIAKLAGVSEIIVCSPPDEKGQLDNHLLYTLEVCGATTIYKIGGSHAIGAMAFGTDTIPKVQKIVGPGGPYVTAAKQFVYGYVDIDMLAGPSELVVLADSGVKAEYIAADMLSQAEHGSGMEKIFLITPSEILAEKVVQQLVIQAEKLPKYETVSKVLTKGTLIVVVNNLDKGMSLCNELAPEHLELLVPEPRNWLKKVENAGAVFTGEWTPEAVGDYAAGPSHVLPTGGTANTVSGLSVTDFQKRTSTVSFTRADLQESLPAIRSLGKIEGMSAHVNSADIRFPKEEK